jgi:hypothetical protein
VFKLGIPKLIRADDWPDDRPFVVLMPQYGADDANDCRLGDEVAAFLRFAIDNYDVDFVEDRVAAIQACDPPPQELQLTVYPAVDHNSWSRTYNLSAGHDVYAWLLEHTT